MSDSPQADDAWPVTRPPAVWQTSRRTLAIPADRQPLVMGILNVTPDSFSDGGRHDGVDAAVAAGLAMVAAGADIIDIGGESTRPYSQGVDAATERERVVPVIERLARQIVVPISIDTSKAIVAAAAMDAGAEIINDVTGLEGDAGMTEVARSTGAGVCVMHMRGTPQTMQDSPQYIDVVAEIHGYLIDRRESCLRAGLAAEAVCLDPGIGFGKTHDHNLELLRATSRFANLGRPLLIGHSRKGFIRKTIARGGRDTDPFDPLAGTLGVTLAAAAGGAHVIRVHDVRQSVDALTLFWACR